MFKTHLAEDRFNRSFATDAAHIALPSIQTDLEDNELNDVLAEIQQVENVFFSLKDKAAILQLKQLNALSQEVKASIPDQEPAPKSESKPKAKEPEVDVAPNDIQARQIYLHNVGDQISGTYAGCGTRTVKKRPAFVFYLSTKEDGMVFLVGTQLQESRHLVQTGDYITITKLEQYRRAKSRQHAKPAVFSVEVAD